MSRNLDPLSHPFSKARERARALNAAKLDRMFAKPFLGALDGHVDGVYSLARKPGVLNLIASGAGDGGECPSTSKTAVIRAYHSIQGIIVHDLPTRTKPLRFPAAHKGVVSGLCFTDDGRILSCGVDRLVKLWDAKTTSDGDGLVDDEEARVTVSLLPSLRVLWPI